MGHTRYLFSIFLLILCSSQQLRRSDVRETFDEMLGFHVEHNELSPPLMQRASKYYFEQFDPTRMYLLEEEARQISRLSKDVLEKGIGFYQVDDLTYFNQLNRIATKAIHRARAIRLELEKELILSSPELEPARGEIFLSFARSQDELKNRLYHQLTGILYEERRLNQLTAWTPKDREKIFYLWEKRFRRKEEPYLNDDEHFIAVHSLRALARSLDAHTCYFSPEEAQEMRMALEKQFEGIGVVLQEGINGVVIIDLVKGGPAEKSGKIHIGDQITHIQSTSVATLSYQDVLTALKGEGKKELTLTLKRNENHFDVTLAKEKIVMQEERVRSQSFPCSNGHIGVLTLPSFYEAGGGSSAEKDLREAIRTLKQKAPLKGLILDMRENAGGFLTQAVKVAGLFVAKGVIVISKYSRGEIKYLRNLDGQLTYDGPLVILTSRASASAAEIVAQALQDYGAALVVGDETTYGKGTIQYQTITDREARSFYKVTVGRYYTVSGRSTQITGVKADIVVPTVFANYKIGERYLENPLPSDQVAAAYIDPLTDIDYKSRAWFQKNYLPNLHQPHDRWHKMLPQLQENSQRRLQNDKNFEAFVTAQSKKTGRHPKAFSHPKNPTWGDEDLQVKEAYHIVQDMLMLEKKPHSS